MHTFRKFFDTYDSFGEVSVLLVIEITFVYLSHQLYLNNFYCEWLIIFLIVSGKRTQDKNALEGGDAKQMRGVEEGGGHG